VGFCKEPGSCQQVDFGNPGWLPLLQHPKRVAIHNLPPDTAPSIHISYHGGEHYNSVRLLDDYTRSKPQPILLGEGGSTAAQVAQVGRGEGGGERRDKGCRQLLLTCTAKHHCAPSTPNYATNANLTQERATWTAADEARVAANTGCDNAALVQRSLRECRGDVDAAIERVIEVMGGDEETEMAPVGAQAAAGLEVQSREEQQELQRTREAAAEVGASSSAEDQDAAAALSPDASPQPVSSSSAAADVESSVDPISSSTTTLQPTDDLASGEASVSVTIPAATGTGASAAAATGSKLKAAKFSGAAKRGVSVGGSTSVVTGLSTKPSRNKPCPCKSSKKYKSCCGVAVAAAERKQRALQEAGAAAAEGGGVPSLLATLHI